MVYKEGSTILLYIPNNPGVAYGITTGEFFKIDALKHLQKLLPVDEEGFVSYWCTVLDKHVKRKAINLAYLAMNHELRSGYTLYFKDSNSRNFKGYNIGCLPKSEYIRLKDASNNLKGDLKLVPHQNDSYSYYVVYRKDNKVIKVKYHDIVCALREKDRIYAESTVICGKYLLSSE